VSDAKDPNRPTPTGMFERFGENYPVGHVLFHEGDPGKHMYVIQSGRVQLTRRVRGREAHLATLPPGEFFGEMAIINKQPRSATATVIEESHLLVLDARTFEAMIRGNAEIAIRMIKKLSLRLSQANSQV
jgi:CRP/FNR family transcriptional regulator, cyclic AMP receptor protein